MIRAAFGPPFAFGRRQQMAGDILTGGRSSIVLTDKVVTRPAGAWTLTVHKFLHALRLHGFASAPEPIGAEGADEQVSYLAGQVFHALQARRRWRLRRDCSGLSMTPAANAWRILAMTASGCCLSGARPN
jgi:hypothetical protein